MDSKQFDTFIKIKIQDLVNTIMIRKSTTFKESLKYLYKSRTYQLLIQEESKVWHFSTPKLYEIINSENHKNTNILPDYT